jgi:hypothetical protein
MKCGDSFGHFSGCKGKQKKRDFQIFLQKLYFEPRRFTNYLILCNITGFFNYARATRKKTLF